MGLSVSLLAGCSSTDTPTESLAASEEASEETHRNKRASFCSHQQHWARSRNQDHGTGSSAEPDELEEQLAGASQDYREVMRPAVTLAYKGDQTPESIGAQFRPNRGYSGEERQYAWDHLHRA